jgi:hypothetical protein
MSVPSQLDHLCEGSNPSLRKEQPDPKEFAGLVKAGLARLADAERDTNSFESRFDLAYNAAHALCLAALRHSGYRASKRYVVFQALPHTLGVGPDVWRVLDHAHGLRNRGEYEGLFEEDEQLLSDFIAACKTVAAKVRKLSPLK